MKKIKEWGNEKANKKDIFIIFPMFIFLVFLLALVLFDNSKRNLGSLADWISGIGSLGAIIVVIWQVNVQKKEYEEDKKQERKQKIISSLPFFNLRFLSNETRTVFLDIASLNEKLPIESLKLAAYWKGIYRNEDGSIKKYRRNSHPKNYGHVYPQKGACKLNEVFTYPGNYWLDRLDLSCRTYNGINVFFTYGAGVNGMHAYQDWTGDWHWYVKDDNSNISEAKKRLEQMCSN